jgi:hypothetical protein
MNQVQLCSIAVRIVNNRLPSHLFHYSSTFTLATRKTVLPFTLIGCVRKKTSGVNDIFGILFFSTNEIREICSPRRLASTQTEHYTASTQNKATTLQSSYIENCSSAGAMSRARCVRTKMSTLLSIPKTVHLMNVLVLLLNFEMCLN